SAASGCYTLSLHDALPISDGHSAVGRIGADVAVADLAQPSALRLLPGWEETPILLVFAVDGAGEVQRIHPSAAPFADDRVEAVRSEEHTSELQSRENLVCR